MSKKLLVWPSGYALFWCPACQGAHAITVNVQDGWTWNGDFERPTTEPSIRVSSCKDVTQCHCYLTDGNIRFCADSPHALAGQTVELPVFPGEDVHHVVGREDAL